MSKQKRSHRFVILFLMLALAVPLLPATTSYAQTATVPDGYIGIYTPQDLSHIRNNLSGNYILMSDLNMTTFTSAGEGWIPIGTKESPFTGILDGNGHSITGLRIYKPVVNTVSFVGGLFAYADGIQIRDLNFSGNYDVTVMRATRYNYLGGLVGYGTGIHVTNTTVALKAKARAETVIVGGIVGFADAPQDFATEKTYLENCSVSGEINGVSKDFDLGGLAGRTVSLKATGCNNSLSIYGLVTVETKNANIGGIAGSVQSFGISNCTNKGKITPEVSTRLVPSSATITGGGIAGRMNASATSQAPLEASISGCINEGPVVSYQKGYLFLGGIAGVMTNSTITNCINRGKVVSSGLRNEGAAAGILSTNSGAIIGCTNEGTIIASGGGSAGISVDNSGTISRCINHGDAGIAGICANNSGTVQQCYNTGTIGSYVGFASSGGIVGSNAGLIEDCYNIGQVVSAVSGGIAADNGLNTSTIRRCYNVGILKAQPNAAGGIAASNIGTIGHSYYYGAGAVGVANNDGTNNSIKLNYSQLLADASFVGFDFVENDSPAVWVISSNSGMPILKGLKEVYLKSLAVQKQPLTRSYLLNKTASFNGLGLKATYSNGKTTLIDSGFSLSSYTKTAGDKTITASYLGKSASFIIHYDKLNLFIEDSTVIRVDWSPIPNATTVRIYWASAAAGPYQYKVTTSSPQFGFEGLGYGKVQYFKIRPMYGSTPGTVSPYAAIRMRPNAPAAIRAEIANNAYTGEGLYVKWAPTIYSERYELSYSLNVGGPYTKLASTFESTSYLHANAVKGTRYYYAVRSYVIVDGVKVYSEYSGIATALNL
jgi:hypothetical protein